MTLKDAIAFLKGAVARGMPGGAASAYTVHDGWIYAQSPAVLAAFPVPHMQGLYSMAADDLEGALARMPSEPELSAGDGTIILKSGRLRSSIQLMEADEPATTAGQIAAGADNETQGVPDGLMRALATALPFVSKNGTWQRGVRIEEGRVLAINNRCGIEISLSGFSPPAPSILTSECVAYLTKLDPPSTVRFAGSYVLFGWPSTAWARCQAMAAEWPIVVDNILNGADDAAPVELTADWRASFDDVAALGDGNVELRAGGLFGRSTHAEHNSEFETGVSRTTHWSLEALKPVFACAERWNPDAQGAARFTGAGLRGVVVGQRR